MFRSTNPNILRNNEKIKSIEDRMRDSLEQGDLEALRQLIIDLEIVCPISGTRNWTEVLPKKLSATALSQQFPKRLMLPAYCDPRSECTIRPGGGRRNQIAIRNASQTSVAFIRELMLQPTTFLENKSITIARYSQPSCVREAALDDTSHQADFYGTAHIHSRHYGSHPIVGTLDRPGRSSSFG
jgi:hypothetical protein